MGSLPLPSFPSPHSQRTIGGLGGANCRHNLCFVVVAVVTVSKTKEERNVKPSRQGLCLWVAHFMAQTKLVQVGQKKRATHGSRKNFRRHSQILTPFKMVATGSPLLFLDLM